MDHQSTLLKNDIAVLLPELRAFSRSLTNHVDRADDLVQDTVLKAWKSRDSFKPGTNLKAWLFTILRNTFYSDRRRAGRIVEDVDNVHTDCMVAATDQQDQMGLQELRRALTTLPDEQREALILIGAGGFSHEEAASIMGVAVGTIKSRVFRARTTLMDMLDTGHGLPDADSVDGSALTAIDSLLHDVDEITSN